MLCDGRNEATPRRHAPAREDMRRRTLAATGKIGVGLAGAAAVGAGAGAAAGAGTAVRSAPAQCATTTGGRGLRSAHASAMLGIAASNVPEASVWVESRTHEVVRCRAIARKSTRARHVAISTNLAMERQRHCRRVDREVEVFLRGRK